mgnify:CR=1 FL=1
MKGLEILDYISDYIGKIMFLTGTVLLVIGALAMNLYGSILSAGSLFFGILFVVFGLFTQLGFLSGKIRSLNGAGTLLICLSIVLAAFGLVVVEFVDVTSKGVVAEIFRGAVMGYRLLLSSDRPYVWLSVICIQVGIGFFLAGLALKIIHLIRP